MLMTDVGDMDIGADISKSDIFEHFWNSSIYGFWQIPLVYIYLVI